MTNRLATQHCVPCEGGTSPLERSVAEPLLAQVPGWTLTDGESLNLSRELKFKNFGEAMAFVNKIVDIAETEGHHPDICISWNHVELKLFTHAIGGLSENDFILAAKFNEAKGGPSSLDSRGQRLGAGHLQVDS